MTAKGHRLTHGGGLPIAGEGDHAGCRIKVYTHGAAALQCKGRIAIDGVTAGNGNIQTGRIPEGGQIDTHHTVACGIARV